MRNYSTLALQLCLQNPLCFMHCGLSCFWCSTCMGTQSNPYLCPPYHKSRYANLLITFDLTERTVILKVIASLLIIYRVSQGKAWSPTTESDISVLQHTQRMSRSNIDGGHVIADVIDLSPLSSHKTADGIAKTQYDITTSESSRMAGEKVQWPSPAFKVNASLTNSTALRLNCCSVIGLVLTAAISRLGILSDQLY